MYGRHLPSTAERAANGGQEEEEEDEKKSSSSSDDDDDEDIYSLAAQQSTSTTPTPPHVPLSTTSLTLIKQDGDVVCVNKGEAPFPTQGYAFFVQKYGAQNAKDFLGPSSAYADRWLKEARVGFRQRGGGAEEEYNTFLSNGGTCGGRKLYWAAMQLPPGATFRLHMHPTLEIIHVIRGALYERRMVGPPLPLVSEEGKKVEEMMPVDLSHLDPPPRFQDNVFSEDSVNVNEMGSVHQSYTSQEEGCLLLCIWAGWHCNIEGSRLPRDFEMGGCCGSGSSAAGAGAGASQGAGAAAGGTQVVIEDD